MVEHNSNQMTETSTATTPSDDVSAAIEDSGGVPPRDERTGSTMARDCDTDRRELLSSITDSPVIAGGKSDRRGLLKGTVATAAALLGVPRLGSTAAQAASDEEVIEHYSQPEQIAASIEQNEDLFVTLDDIGLFEGARGGGLQVSSVSVEGEQLPEQRLYVGTDFGMLSIVISPNGVPLGGEASVVTNEEKMAEAPFEWPRDKMTELPDGRNLFTVDRNGWSEAGFKDVEYVELVTELCGSLMECKGPTTDRCGYINCCGKFERIDSCADNDDSSIASFQPCDGGACGELCWEVNGDCACIHESAFCSS